MSRDRRLRAAVLTRKLWLVINDLAALIPCEDDFQDADERMNKVSEGAAAAAKFLENAKTLLAGKRAAAKGFTVKAAAGCLDRPVPSTMASATTVSIAAPDADSPCSPAPLHDEGQRAEERGVLAQRWLDRERKLIEQAVQIFMRRCAREMEQGKCDATISFEVLSREIDDFPKRIFTDATYFVDTWGGGLGAESWVYATHGLQASWSPGAPVLFSEVLLSMFPKFVEAIMEKGFKTCVRVPGTWKLKVSWAMPDEVVEVVAPSPKFPIDHDGGSRPATSTTASATMVANLMASTPTLPVQAPDDFPVPSPSSKFPADHDGGPKPVANTTASATTVPKAREEDNQIVKDGHKKEKKALRKARREARLVVSTPEEELLVEALEMEGDLTTLRCSQCELITNAYGSEAGDDCCYCCAHRSLRRVFIRRSPRRGPGMKLPSEQVD